MPTTTTFRGLQQLGDSTLTEIIRSNIVAFIDWGLIDKGGYFNVNIGQSGNYGGDLSRLRPVSDPRYSTGKVWEGQHSNWVWESGVSRGDPIPISGVWINGSLLPHSGYTVDYPNGRIIFNEARSRSSVVQVEHSYKYVNVTDAKNIPFYRTPAFRNNIYDSSNFFVGSGQYTEFVEGKVSLPAIAIETANTSYKPYELGTGNRWVNTDVVFHILAESDGEAARLADIISYQDEKNIHLFDLDRMAESDRFPLTIYGDIADNALSYPQLVLPSGDGGFRYRGTQGGQLRLSNCRVQPGNWQDNSLYTSAVRITCQVIQLNLD